MQALGAALRTPRRLQSDVLLDTTDGRLASSGCALRVRADGARAVLTFKGPVHPGTLKVREEIETGADSAAVLLDILAAVAFTPAFRYEKYREEYRPPRCGDRNRRDPDWHIRRNRGRRGRHPRVRRPIGPAAGRLCHRFVPHAVPCRGRSRRYEVRRIAAAVIDSAIILAAGLGTRLAPLSAVRAKAALPIAGQPIIRRQLAWLAEAGVRRVVVNLHHLPWTVTRVVGHGDDPRARGEVFLGTSRSWLGRGTPPGLRPPGHRPLFHRERRHAHRFESPGAVRRPRSHGRTGNDGRHRG